MTDVSNQRVGFVGFGDQGGPMALAIVEAGFLLHAWATLRFSTEKKDVNSSHPSLVVE
jgi:3-hydroxyisobutyrate dehydrogenase-like beta-hydroxyacid dehydrogenase